MSTDKAFEIRLFGKVQGVFMRATLKQFADELGIAGFAKNEKDGSVLVHAQGPELPLTQFVNFCKQGSSLGKIETLTVTPVELDTALTSFDIA